MTGAFIWKYENTRQKDQEQKFLDPVIKYFKNLPPPPKVKKVLDWLFWGENLGHIGKNS